jgi:hypothetical protein
LEEKTMKKLFVTIVALLTFFCLVPNLFAQTPMDDVVYLKDGSIVRGQIIEQIPNVSIKIQTRDGSVFVYQMEKIEKMTKEPSLTQQTQTKQVKNSTTAFLLSFLIPGLGQHYNGEYGKGVIMEVLCAGGIVLALTAGYNEVEDYWYSGGYEYYDYYTEITAWYYIGFGVSLASEIWSMIDAPISANRINKEISQRKYGHLIEIDKNNYALGFDLSPQKQRMEAKLTLHF